MATRTRHGNIKGEPIKYLRGHFYRGRARLYQRKSDVEYVVDEQTGCWIWQLRLINKYGGYGHDQLAHRVYYERYVGPIPDGYEIHHLCRNPPCVNPNHLEVLTHEENMRLERGQPRFCKLSAEDVLAIRRMAKEGRLQREIAESFDVDASHVSKIISRKKHPNVATSGCG